MILCFYFEIKKEEVANDVVVKPELISLWVNNFTTTIDNMLPSHRLMKKVIMYKNCSRRTEAQSTTPSYCRFYKE